MSNMQFWIGVVIQNNDLQNAGRVKVRVLGVHDETVQHTDLPWAPVVDGTYGAATSIPRLGEWVFGGFMDGSEGQHPLVLGVLPGYHGQMGQQTQGGDVDANLSVNPNAFGTNVHHAAVIGEGTSRLTGPLLALADNDNTIKDSADRTYKEPQLELPDRTLSNRVLSSQDHQNYVVLSNADNGLIQIQHFMGTVIQIDKEGTLYIKSTNMRSDSTYGGHIDYVKGSRVTTVENGDYMLRVEGPSGGNAKIFVTGDIDIDCENMNITTRGDMNLNVKGSYNLRAADVKEFAYLDNMNLVAAQQMKLQSITNMSLKSFTYLDTEALIDTTIVSGVDTNITSLIGNIDMYASLGMDLTALGADIDVFATIGNVNVHGLAQVNLDALEINLDTFVNMATGRAVGRSTPTTPAVPASLLGIFAAAPDLPDITESYPGGGFKSGDVPMIRMPNQGANQIGTTGSDTLTLAGIGTRITNIADTFNKLTA